MERQDRRRLTAPVAASDPDVALPALEAFEEKWDAQIPVIGQAWRSAWEHVTPFMAFPEEVRRVVYTTNAVEALNRQLRKAIKTKGHFPAEDAARKLLYLAIQNAVPKWTRTRGWTKALLAFQNPVRRPIPQLTINHRLHRKTDTLTTLGSGPSESAPRSARHRIRSIALWPEFVPSERDDAWFSLAEAPPSGPGSRPASE
jgi:hypothetical protein